MRKCNILLPGYSWSVFPECDFGLPTGPIVLSSHPESGQRCDLSSRGEFTVTHISRNVYILGIKLGIN